MTQADRPSIEITQDADWRRLIDRTLTTVVDPMVLRAGEIFMRGRSGQAFGRRASSFVWPSRILFYPALTGMLFRVAPDTRRTQR